MAMQTILVATREVEPVADFEDTGARYGICKVAAEKADNPSRRAAAILKVATAHANSSDSKMAADVAGRIDLTPADEMRVQIFGKERFNYKLPRTWGDRYDDTSWSTMATIRRSSERAAEVAGAAMTLAQALGEKPAESYAVLFDDINTDVIIRTLARAHAASGDANEALAWAKKIGSNSKAKPHDNEQMWAVERRIHALIGVAEGILERSGDLPPKPEP